MKFTTQRIYISQNLLGKKQPQFYEEFGAFLAAKQRHHWQGVTDQSGLNIEAVSAAKIRHDWHLNVEAVCGQVSAYDKVIQFTKK